MVYKIYIIVLAIYAGVEIFIGFLLRLPAFHRLANRCDHWPLIRFIKWMHQVRCSLNMLSYIYIYGVFSFCIRQFLPLY